jgi:uncharacterized protein YndB with AHSA1/START domain
MLEFAAAMATRTTPAPPSLDVNVEISATPRIVLEAFFDAAQLSKWCGTIRSVTQPRMLGPFALEWAPSEQADAVLGRLGGFLRGTVMQHEPTRGFFVADLFWLPPDAGPIGPMALDVSCTLCLTADGRPATRVQMRQTGFEESARWRRYYEVVGARWQHALESLKALLEAHP